jgi:hypothetical protein
MEKIIKKLKIMIVEDEDILILYKDFLLGKGHDVTTTYVNGENKASMVTSFSIEESIIPSFN